ncbi:MAG TPA: DUF4097 family beta strand repeat-containing protein [Verrucomicrobiae bacterium]|nr:DUF4097 family beta strand repeat-containing protein [Verrucomicrobiae bacterium]
MKTTLVFLLAGSLVASAITQETLNKQFNAQPGGKIVVEVDFGSIDVSTNASNEVTVEVLRKVTRSSKQDEEAFLRENPVSFSQDGNVVTVVSHSKSKLRGLWQGNQRTEAKYTISVPASFSAQLRTSGGGIAASDLASVKAETSGGGFHFARLHGDVNARTSGGGIHVADCDGPLKLQTSGGGIEVLGGSGSLEGDTTGGPVTVRNFRGPAHVESSGGGITIENVNGKTEGSTSGGSISGSFSAPLSDEIKLSTSGGGVTLRVPDNSAFDLDASTSGGTVHSDLPVSGTGKPNRSHLKGPVNGGGKPVVLRTSGGSIYVKKS